MADGVVAFNNFGDLIQSVGLYLDIDPNEPTDPTAVALPGFVRLAEATIGRRVRCMENLARSWTMLDFPEEFLPTDFGSIRSAIVGPVNGPFIPLSYLRPDIFEQVPDPGCLGLYTMYAGRLLFYPNHEEFFINQDPPLQLRLVYFNRPRLTDMNSTNAMLTYHPDIYLYGSLLAAGSFVIDAARTATWGQLYDSAVDTANLSYDESHGTMTFAGVLGP